jgi:cation diffusion facilitator CzcD-associated flavoprotein CzcO/acetyl esterase/lipase
MSALTLSPRGVRFERAHVGGVPGEWVRPVHPVRTADGRGTVLYLHGGAYCVGSPRSHRAITGHLARFTGRTVFVADYRLAPEHPYPAALDDALACLAALSQDGEPVALAGDSAGGGLALATALAARARGLPRPAALWLLSPWVDLAIAPGPVPSPPGEAMLGAPWARACAAHYRGDTPASHPGCSPLNADLHGLPPVLIQVGTDELLYGDALRLHDALFTAGVPVHAEVAQRRWHVWQLHAGVLPSATEAVRRAATFLQPALSGEPALPAPAPGQPRRHQVLVLGAGMSGLCTAIQLQRAGIHDFVVLEKSEGLGGTWWDNRYPGAHVDVPAPLYSFSFAPNPGWKRRFAAASEIQAYMEDCATRFGVRAHLRFGTAVAAAHWDDDAALWRVHTAAGEVLEAPWFVCSTGPLNQARWPDIPGLDTFAGPRLHSARWDDGVALAGRRIGVIGTGSTASQLIPPLAEAAGRLSVFQRTANWVLPRLDRPYTALDRTLARIPPVAAAVRHFWYAVLEWGRRGFDDGTAARRSMLGLARRQLSTVNDAELRARLQPPYPLGCKRIIYSNDYYPALMRPQVALVTEAIERITPTGVRTADGTEHPLDVLVCATGFDTTHLLASLDLRGRGGRRLADAWADGPAAHRGVTVPGFPNLFLMLGPNTATGHTSTLLFVEPQVRFAIDAMRRTAAAGARAFEVRPEAFETHNAALQARLAGSVWSQCRSWYRTDSGRIVALWPGFTGEYVRGLTAPDWGDYQLA